MSKFHINTKAKDYLKDKEAFMKELKNFNEGKSVPFKTPYVNGGEIDLYLFYTLVQQKGGLSKVNQQDAWDSFLRPLRLPHPCINGSTLLRKIYGTYLEKFEKAKGPPGRDDDNDLEEDSRRGRGGVPRASYSGAYISATGHHLTTAPKPVAGPSERLALSLLSPMPNEQDFAINICTILAADAHNRLPLNTVPHILDFLLAHAGVYNHPSLRDTIGRSYLECRGRAPDDFWRLCAGGGGVAELADETHFMMPGLEQPELMVQALAAHNTLTDRLSQDDDVVEICETPVEEIRQKVPEPLEEWMSEPSDEDSLFAPELSGGASCVYTQRVLQVASIVRELSFHEDNLPALQRNTTLVRFLLLCSNCWVGSLRRIGLDTLGNVCSELVIKDPATCLLSRHVLSTVQSCLQSDDRARILAALEMLTKLAQNEENEEVLIRSIEDKVYESACQLLRLRDIMLLVCSLECVFALTSLGERASESVARVPRLVRTLVTLVTVEAQSYGPRACIQMRVVETVSGPPPEPAPALAALQQVPTTPVKPTERPIAPAAPAAQAAPAPASSLQQAHQQQQTVQENSQFALAWLRAAYEPLPPADNSLCDSREVYRQYLACCTKLGRKGVIAPAHFPRLVRTVFGGTVGPNSVTISTGETQKMYVGIRQKNAPKLNPPAGPSSPILKAQLTSKAAAEAKAVVIQTQSSPAPSSSGQPLDPAASNTSLIKHLLANKVSPSPSHQVAQRQQNQQRVIAPVTGVTTHNNQPTMEVDPESLIKCTTIIPNVAGQSGAMEKVIVSQTEELMVPKEEAVQIQIDEQQQLTIKTAQNKMLADLLEKKSNPPVQVVQMTPQMNAPTIQITETGQIVQVKNDPVIQLTDSPHLPPPGPYFQIKNDQGQIIQLKNDQGQIIQLKSDQLGGQFVLKSDPGGLQQQLVQNAVQLVPTQFKGERDCVVADHSYTEPPAKRVKVEEKREVRLSPKPTEAQVSKTAANLYAALAASALEDEEDLMPAKPEPQLVHPPPVVIQEPIMQVQQPTMQVQQATMTLQPPPLQMSAPALQVHQPLLQVQPADAPGLLPPGQLVLQDKPMTSQTQYIQQPMQLIATPSSSQGGISYLTQNIPSNMMQKTIIIVQGATGGGPITLTVNNPGGLDEATLNSVIAQATEAITQQQMIQNTGVLQTAQRVIVSQPTLVPASQPYTVVKASIAQNASQLQPSQQPIITTAPQPHKAQIIQAQQIVTQKPVQSHVVVQGNQLLQGNQQLLQANQQLMHGNQQLLQGNQQIIVSNNQQILVNPNVKARSQRTPSSGDNKQQTVIQTSGSAGPQMVRQVIRQPVMMGGTKIGEKETVVTQPAEPPQCKTPTPTLAPRPSPPPDDTPWVCHWKGCGKTFDSAASVYAHCARTHCPRDAAVETRCQWADCDRAPRKTFALLNHLSDRHCTPQALKALYNSSRGAEAEGARAAAVGYPPNAAMAALNKHAVEFLNPRELMQRADANRTVESTDENEGPVTKSIRLTAALILRNLVIYSNTGRRLLRGYESHLATIALSTVEASRTIAQVLYDMNNI